MVFQSSDPRAVSLPTGVNETETQATGLENAPGVMNVEQADESTEKSVLVLDGDDDSDQDDFTSPGKDIRTRTVRHYLMSFFVPLKNILFNLIK